jgi:DNA-binding transcriptional regulator YdaS (Cro superfamily)
MKKQDVITYFGGISRLAEALSIAPSAVSQWRDEIPRLRAYQIERITNGVLTVKDLPNEYKQAS